jgi:ribosome biogenesis protein ERB1
VARHCACHTALTPLLSSASLPPSLFRPFSEPTKQPNNDTPKTRSLSWWDLDLATTPFKALHFHKKATRAVRFHKRYPLLASSSDDGTVHVFHAKVFNDLLTNPLIVPVKILRQRAEVAAPAAVHDCVFHPTQPWLFSCSDEKIALFTNVD